MKQNYKTYNLTKDNLKEDYITKIVNLLTLCDDISLLDLIKQLLEKSI